MLRGRLRISVVFGMGFFERGMNLHIYSIAGSLYTGRALRWPVAPVRKTHIIVV